ncbi:MAG TPA: class II glutamine amidotransferase [Hyphomicrobiaceae bacterium]|nr:class II glutamine amidotransferase [Hyphomicrobiaceae bacterium]
MCRWIAYLGEPIFLEDFVTQPAQSLVVQSRSSREARNAVNGDGFGLGWYGERPEPGLFRDVRPAWSDENLLSLAHQIRSPLFFAHVRASTGTATTRANCHPFRYERWLFMHNGKIGGWERLRRKIEMAIPDALFAHRHGTTDSEVIFLLMLANGLNKDPQGATARTIAFIESVLRREQEAEPLRCTAAFTDGERIYAVRYASNRAPDTLYTRNRRDNSGKLLVSEPLDDGRDDWRAIPVQSFITLGPDGERIEPFEVALAA